MEREEEETLSTPGVIEKYQISAKIANGNFQHYGRGVDQTHQENLSWIEDLRTVSVV